MASLVSDIRSFVLHKPSIPTLIAFDSETAREDYSHRIAQRLGINVTQYAILNIHRIGIEAPTRHVFEELLRCDNARYLLYECSGGYPVGVCGIYIRSPIVDLGETEQAQAFFAVGFNFYGKETWSRKHTINKLWEGIHNRGSSITSS